MLYLLAMITILLAVVCRAARRLLGGGGGAAPELWLKCSRAAHSKRLPAVRQHSSKRLGIRCAVYRNWWVMVHCWHAAGMLQGLQGKTAQVVLHFTDATEQRVKPSDSWVNLQHCSVVTVDSLPMLYSPLLLYEWCRLMWQNSPGQAPQHRHHPARTLAYFVPAAEHLRVGV